MTTPRGLDDLMNALRCLPGVGPRSAQRMAYHLLQRDHEGAQRLADSLCWCVQHIRHCEKCNNFTEEIVCELSPSPQRDASLLCVVAMAADLLMIEQAHGADHAYFLAGIR